ncbi:hemerythrin domain-containing protein [Metallosphaera tengchongensis]|uniref:Hemerythrin domain-containing protein n=1 Tax=Metallosphaera tengchongensis TaxID=1532350 RepID=A0A6N0NYE3_9CREN|nr:hemerythrin domain-containing protein [Metallosphaera tengchongensis]QKR00823.1 hemerythrin domain-containing protein [Metallosphaera tengchongensis]
MSLIDRLVQDHAEEDVLLEKVKAIVEEGRGDGQVMELMDRFSRNLKYHIFLEEEYLFPMIAGEYIFRWNFELMNQHVALWNLVEKIESSFRRGELEEVKKSVYLLSSLLKVHNAIEERNGIYEEIGKALKERGGMELPSEMPKGWSPKFMTTPTSEE